jgi:hypothetical protein
MPVLARPGRQPDTAVFDLEVTVRRRDENLGGSQLLSVGGGVTRQQA